MLEAEGAGSIREAGFIIAGMAIGGILYTLIVKGDAPADQRLCPDPPGWRGLCAQALVSLALLHQWPPKIGAFALVGFGFYMIHNSIQTQVTELAPDARGVVGGAARILLFPGASDGTGSVRLWHSDLVRQPRSPYRRPSCWMLGFATAAGFAARQSVRHDGAGRGTVAVQAGRVARA